MKTAKLLLFLFSLYCITACTKSTKAITPPAAVVVVHAMQQGKTIIPVFSADPLLLFAAAKTITYGTAAYYSLISGDQPMYIVKMTDTLKPVFRNNFELASAKIYSLFIAGDTARPDVVFVEDAVPVFNDSVCGVRFVNLSPASKPINVNIKGNGAAKTELTGIGYKQVSDFKTYEASSKLGKKNYIFEVRNQANDSLLLTYTWTFPLFKSHTLVLTGIVNAAGKPATLKIFPVNNY